MIFNVHVVKYLCVMRILSYFNQHMISCVLALSGKLVFVYGYLPHKIVSEVDFAFQISLLAIMDIIDIIGIIDHNGHYGRLCPLCPMKSIKSILETYFLLRNQLLFPKGIFFPEIDLESKLI